MHKKNNKQNGYTIIETMIAVSLFLVVVTIGMGALLNANLLHQKSRDMRSIMDNLSFIMEDMSRNIRTGYNYYCVPVNVTAWPSSSTTLSGPNCSGIAFEPAAGGPKWAYQFVSGPSGSVTIYYIRKSTDNGTTWIQLTPDEVVIDTVASGFSILGAEPPNVNANKQQPFVTIRLVGSITYKNIVTPFSLQTSVSQRLIDI